MHGGSQEKGSLSVLLVRVNGGDVVHFQEDVSHITTLPIRLAGLIVAAITVTAYICQYAIVKTGSNNEVIVWIVAQAAAALLRVLYWTTFFDLPWTKKAEYAVINNSASNVITLVEVLAACTKDHLEVPRWAWTYLSSTPFWQILKDAVHNSHNDVIPKDASHYVFQDISIRRLIENRRRTTNKEDANYVENTMWSNVWSIAVWMDENYVVRPFIVIPMEYNTAAQSSTDECFMQASATKVNSQQSAKRLVDPCNIFACGYGGQRLHIQPWTMTNEPASAACIHGCHWGRDTTNSHEHKHAGISMHTDAQVVEWLDWLLGQDPDDKGLGYTTQFDRERKRHIYITATAGTLDRTGDFFDYEQAWTSRVNADLKAGIADVREYIAGHHNCEKLRQSLTPGQKLAKLVRKPFVRLMTSKEPARLNEKV